VNRNLRLDSQSRVHLCDAVAFVSPKRSQARSGARPQSFVVREEAYLWARHGGSRDVSLVCGQAPPPRDAHAFHARSAAGGDVSSCARVN
jgi:hypothetical protein